jgi:hypothetical protein
VTGSLYFPHSIHGTVEPLNRPAAPQPPPLRLALDAEVQTTARPAGHALCGRLYRLDSKTHTGRVSMAAMLLNLR